MSQRSYSRQKNSRSHTVRRPELARTHLSVEVLEDRTVPATIYGITPGNVLIRFDSASPNSVTTIGAVSGLGASQTIRGIDFRPRSGGLYASTVTTGSAANSIIFTYRINPLNAQATFVGQTAAALAGAADVPTGYDFNPTVDRIRYTNTNDENARLNPVNGALAGNDTDLTPAATTTIIAEAYDRNFDRQSITSPVNNNVIPTTLYAIDRNDSQLAIQGGINGTPSPNAGVIIDLAPLGFTLNAANDGGFDIAPGAGLGRAFAALTDAADNLTRLYSINLVTGISVTPVATSLGLIGNGTIEVRSIAIALPNDIEVYSTDAGTNGRVRVVDPLSRAILADFRVFGTLKVGVRVAVGDVNADGFSDVIVAAGAGARSRVQVIDGSKFSQIPFGTPVTPGVLLANFLAYSPAFTGGVFVGAGDVNGDGRADIITGPGSGRGTVKVIDGGKLNQVTATGRIAPSALLGNFFAYAPGFAGGVTVGSGDVNGDGLDDVITGQAKGGSFVKVVDGSKLGQVGADGRIANTALLSAFLAFAPSFKRGVFVAGTDVTGDGRSEIFIGAGGGGAPVAKVFNANGSVRFAFFAFPQSFQGGVRVAPTDIADGPERDGIADLLFGQGPPGRIVGIRDGETFSFVTAFVAIPGARGVFVAGS